MLTISILRSVLSWLSEALREPSGSRKPSSSRFFIFFAAVSYALVFLYWFVVAIGILTGAFEWPRFEGVIVTGGIGLLGLIFGATGIYWSNRRFPTADTPEFGIGEEETGREWRE